MFSKPVSKIEEQDIQLLVDNEQKESVILEYKENVSNTDKEKRELPKDISAMANTDGGFVIFGVKEEDSRASEIVGINKLIGKQPVEEWIENILISSIRPKVLVKPKVIPISFNVDKVILVLQVSKSPHRPHMVTVGGKNAYYKRHNYQSSYADEHEVRSMFLESKTSIDEMKDFLESRNLNDTRKDNFAHTPLSEEVADNLALLDELPKNFIEKPFALFASCPRYLEERVDIASVDFRDWLSENGSIELFGSKIEFLNYHKEITGDSIRSISHTSTESNNRVIEYYVEIFRNGYVESGTAELMWNANGKGLLFHIGHFTISFWLFMKFLKVIYIKIGYVDEISVIIALSGIEDITISGFGRKNDKGRYSNPYDSARLRSSHIAKQNKFLFQKNLIISELDNNEIEKTVKEVSKRVSNTFGEVISKCFNENGAFDRNVLRGFRNIPDIH